MWHLRGTFCPLVYFCAVLHHYGGLVRVTCLFSGFTAIPNSHSVWLHWQGASIGPLATERQQYKRLCLGFILIKRGNMESVIFK